VRVAWVRGVAGDRNDPLAALLRALELLPAVLGGERLDRDDEDEALGRVDVVVDVLLPLGGRRDVLPVDPDVSVLALQVVVEGMNEHGVDARVGDEDIGHRIRQCPGSVVDSVSPSSFFAPFTGCGWSRITLLR
jgi:hypothetical protein